MLNDLRQKLGESARAQTANPFEIEQDRASATWELDAPSKPREHGSRPTEPSGDGLPNMRKAHAKRGFRTKAASSSNVLSTPSA